jgi:hypothetical protein
MNEVGKLVDEDASLVAIPGRHNKFSSPHLHWVLQTSANPRARRFQ